MTEALNLQIKGGYRNYDRRWAEDNYPTNLQLREHDGVQQQIFPADIALNYRHAGNSVLTVGADFQAATYKTYAEVNGSRSTGNDITAYTGGACRRRMLFWTNGCSGPAGDSITRTTIMISSAAQPRA